MSSTAASSSAPEQGFRRSAVILLGMLGAIQVADPILSSLALVKASDELNFSASTQSLAAGISTLALAATAIPGGMLADRYGRRSLAYWTVRETAATSVALWEVFISRPLPVLGKPEPIFQNASAPQKISP